MAGLIRAHTDAPCRKQNALVRQQRPERRSDMTGPHGFTDEFTQPEPARAEIDTLAGPAVLEFGTGWCGFCRSAQPLLASAFSDFPLVRHIKVEDGSGRRLGRSFGVKLWPTLVFLRDGVETARLVRPQNATAIAAHLATIAFRL